MADRASRAGGTPGALAPLRSGMAACAAAPAGAAAAAAAAAGDDDGASTRKAALQCRLLGYFLDAVDGEPGAAEADPLQARPSWPRLERARAELTQTTVLGPLRLLQGLWLEGDSLAPFVVTPMANVLRALECAPCGPGRCCAAACANKRSPLRCASLAQVGPADTVLDVGCGDGRVVVRAARANGRLSS